MSLRLCDKCGTELTEARAFVDSVEVEPALIYCSCKDSGVEEYTIEEIEDYIEYFKETKSDRSDYNNREKLLLDHIGGSILEVHSSESTDTVED